jgi:hypothetical protein
LPRPARVERAGRTLPGGEWHFSRRSAIWLALPFASAAGGRLSRVLAVYAATSFFICQHFGIRSNAIDCALTPSVL